MMSGSLIRARAGPARTHGPRPDRTGATAIQGYSTGFAELTHRSPFGFAGKGPAGSLTGAHYCLGALGCYDYMR